MWSLPRRYLVLVFLLALGLAGCGSKFDKSETFDVDSGSDHLILVDAPRSNQKVVTVTNTSGTPIDLYIIQAGTDVGAREAIDKKSANILASKIKTADSTVEATVPSGKEYVVAVVNNGAKKATVKITVTGR